MNKKLTPNQKDVIDTIVIVMLAIIAALVALCLTFASGKAMQAENESTFVRETSSVCTTPAGFWNSLVNQDDVEKYKAIYLGYCSPKGQETSKKSVQERTVSNKGTIEKTVETKVIVDNGGSTVDNGGTTETTKEKKERCNNGFGNGPDTACKTHGNAQNQDNTGTHMDGKDMSKGDNSQP